MIVSLQFIEYLCVLLPISLTVLHLFQIFHKKKLITICKESPPMGLLFISIICMVIADAVMANQWILVHLGLIKNVPENSLLLALPVLLRVALQLFFGIANLAIYAQRTYILLFPLKPLKRANKIIVFVELTVTLAAASVGVVPNVPRSFDFIPIPKDCLSANCSNLLPRRTYSATTTLVLSILILLVGGIFQYVFYKYRKSQPAFSEKTTLHRFARYTFYIRLFFEAVPYFTDLLLTNAFGLPIASRVGPYGLVACSLDYCASTFVYYNLVIKKTTPLLNVTSLGTSTS
ncbi:hypothetical protein QR680_011887 [Steinernema hermaphroditum]|uniref:Uncharacterized protein n=1 Tax=Steinernema hermaphroditum TaxID=289476 RepID=A0AA39I1B8_9BILA|nr:hypothetical protein QR680_011887 [Steinernema hermaphroditum]